MGKVQALILGLMDKVQCRTTVEWELSGSPQDLMKSLARVGVTSTTEQVSKALDEWLKHPRIGRGWTTPLAGYQKKAKPKVVTPVAESSGTENWE